MNHDVVSVIVEGVVCIVFIVVLAIIIIKKW